MPVSAPSTVTDSGGFRARPWMLAFPTLALLGAVAMGESDRLVAGALDDNGISRTFSGEFGLGRAVHPMSGAGAWTAWHQRAATAAPLCGYLIADVVLLVGVLSTATVLARLLGVRVRCWLVVLFACSEVAELVWAVIALGSGNGVGLGVLTAVKWAIVAALLGSALRRPCARRRALEGARLVGYALQRQRFSVLALLPVVTLGIASGPNIFDQLPDIERSWLDGPLGYWHLAVATIALGVVAVGLFVLGRLRSDHVRDRSSGASSDEVPAATNRRRLRFACLPEGCWLRQSWRWLLAAALLGVVALAVRLAGGDVATLPLLIVGGVLLAVPLVSFFVRRRVSSNTAADWAYEKDRAVHEAVRRAGDALAFASLSLAGVGLVRAFVAPVVLGLRPLVVGWVAILVGASAAVGVWFMAPLLVAWLTSLIAKPKRRSIVPATTLVAGLLVIALLGLLPFPSSRYLGVLACLMLAVGGLVAFVGAIVAITQRHPTQPVFRWLGLRTTPVVSIMLLAAVVSGYQGGNTVLHGIRGLGQGDLGSRPTLGHAFAAWMSDPSACERTATVATPSGSHKVAVRPMVLLATAGGGIRATYWTAAALDRIAAPGSCAAHSLLLSSGVSGGSLGLTLATTAATATPPDPMSATASTDAIAGPDALGAATVGLLIRDGVAGALGLQMPALDPGNSPSVPQDGGWLDRAALIQSAWAHDLPATRKPFLQEERGPAGWLLLNSTSVDTSCRVVISQLDLGTAVPAKTRERVPDCLSNPSAVLPATFDLLQSYAGGNGKIGSCIAHLDMATAALLSSRFPYVTPSGVVGPCGGFDPQQIVDGGYAENTGLGTLVDLAPRWQELVREANAPALAALAAPPRPGALPTLVVPVIVLLENRFGTDLAAAPSGPTVEVAVPLKGTAAASTQRGEPALVQRAAAITAPELLCGPASPDICDGLTEAVAKVVPHQVAVVAPATAPTITAPLGWVLSGDSRAALDAALDADAYVQRKGEVGALGDVLALLR